MLARTAETLLAIARQENRHAKHAKAVVNVGGTWFHVSNIGYVNNRRTDTDGIIVIEIDDTAPHSAP